MAAALSKFAPLTRDIKPSAILQPYPAQRVIDAFENLQAPLALARHQGRLLNPWLVAGLRRDELRAAQALAGLWMMDFGGATSRTFLGACLAGCIAGVDWHAELAGGYTVSSEVSPLGERSDRIDLAIETTHHVVGIEVKIDARLGPRQLERYIEAIKTRAYWRHATGHVVLLAPFESPLAQVPHLPWSALAEAAEAAVDTKPSARSVVEQLIVSFSEYAGRF